MNRKNHKKSDVHSPMTYKWLIYTIPEILDSIFLVISGGVMFIWIEIKNFFLSQGPNNIQVNKTFCLIYL